MRLLIIALLLALPAAADELVLKNGTTVEWTSLKDLGESFEVESKGGVKLEVKKSEVARIDFRSRASDASDAAKADAALTGATFTFDKSLKLVQFDLLKSIDTKESKTGDWKIANGVMLADGSKLGGACAHLETSYVPPEEYDLTMTVEQVQGKNHFTTGLVGGGKQFCVSFNYEGSGWNGIHSIDGKTPPDSKFSVKENLFPKPGTKRLVQIMVRKFGVAVRVDGKDYMAFKGDWSRVASPGGEYVADKKTSLFFLVKCTNFYKVHGAVVTFPK
ncbi:MAG TPA: hypothetical protein VNM14_21650 [Planctomycetota bacterium]|nr:hypothetical protein [Planctomycetota bacterium]